VRELEWSLTPRDVEKIVPFRMLVPHEGPVTYTGFILNVEWKVIAMAEIHGGPDQTAELELTVKPRSVARREA
jgi:hypothetical protein